jgi:CBS domain-containing protein
MTGVRRRAMKCQELMTLDLRWVFETTSVLDAAVVMRDSSVGFLPVLDAEGALVGVVTDRDLATRVVARNLFPAITTVAQVMSKPAIVCLEEEPISRAEEVMADSQLTRLPVLGPQNRVVGVISLADIVTRRRGAEALRTARAVLARDSAGPHQPIDDIHLTAAELPRPPGPDHVHVDGYSRTRDEARSVESGRYPGVR